VQFHKKKKITGGGDPHRRENYSFCPVGAVDPVEKRKKLFCGGSYAKLSIKGKGSVRPQSMVARGGISQKSL